MPFVGRAGERGVGRQQLRDAARFLKPRDEDLFERLDHALLALDFERFVVADPVALHRTEVKLLT